MKLLDFANLPAIPTPWAEGGNIPWNEPGFSQRMLKEHLSQDHDAASRRFEKIEKQVDWVHHKLLLGRPTKILDLCCGPGLYANRLAKLGHNCVGIDYSSASIAYATNTANKESLACAYLHQDIRTAEYGKGFGLVMLIYGEFNVFKPDDAREILQRANRALTNNGLLLLEPQTFTSIEKAARQKTSWYFVESGLFSDKPHLCLEQRFWDAVSATTTTRFFIIDASTGEVTRYALSAQAYNNAQYHSLLAECGFEEVKFFPSLTGTEDESQSDLMVILTKKREHQSG